MIAFIHGNVVNTLAYLTYYFWLQTYHPTRVLTIAYQPFAFGITCILTYHEAKLNTRKRNLIGFALFLISSFALIMVSTLPCVQKNIYDVPV